MSAFRSPLIYAHRGASRHHRENTLAAFRGAVEQAADAVELDVRASRDGGLVVHHDPVFADGRTVWATPPADRPSGCIELSEALDACAPLLVNVEIKNSPGDLGGPEVPHDLAVVDRVLGLLEDRRSGGVEDRVVISSFDEPTLDRTRAQGVVDTALLMLDPTTGGPERAAAAGDLAVNVWDPMVDAALVERCAELGVQLNVWTVDDTERLLELAALGVDGLITNVPAIARAAIS